MNPEHDYSDEKPDDQAAWNRLSYEEKNAELFDRQKKLLSLFLAKHAIDRAQYEKSLRDLTAKFNR